MTRWLLPILLLSWASPVFAEEVDRADPVAVALHASEIHELHCGEAKRDDLSAAGSSIAAVGQALTIVDDGVRRSREPSLLYWRGLLASCVGRRDQTVADLAAFLDSTDEGGELDALRRDAQRRLDRLQARKTGRGADPRIGPALGLGVAFGSASGAAAGLAGWQFELLEQARTTWVDPGLERGEYPNVQAQGEAAALRTNALIGLSAGLAAAAVIAPLVAATAPRRASGRAAVVIVPSPGGLAVVGAMSW